MEAPMKTPLSHITAIAVLLVIVFTPLLVRAEDSANDIALLASFAMIDYSQTVESIYQNTGYHEINPVLGPYPSRQDLIAFGTVEICLSYVLTEILPDTWRHIVVDSIISTEKLNIEDNRQISKGWNTSGPPLRGRTMDGIPIIVTMRF